jgi:hypothetical protein
MKTIEILNGLMTLFIAGFVAYIAYQQYLLNKKLADLDLQKIKFELYEKRYRIFSETKKILHKIVQDSKIDLIELRDFRFVTNDRLFLFDDDIIGFIDQIRSNAIELNHLTEDVKDLSRFPVGSYDREQKVNRDSELTHWFSNEYENVESRFLKYLDLKRL